MAAGELKEARLAHAYEITILRVRPGTHPAALAILAQSAAADEPLLACWYSDIGAVNQILLIRDATDIAATIDARLAAVASPNPFGVGEFLVGITIDTFVSFDFMAPMQPGAFGPVYEVRSYVLKPGGLAATVDAWRKSAPARMEISPALAAMTSLSGAVTRFMHIWPYKSFDERARLRDKAVADGVWPPPGGPGLLVSQQVDIYLPAAFSPMR